MTTPDRPTEPPIPPVVTPIDPAMAVRVILLDAEYLKAQAAAMVRAQEPEDVTHMDLSPLGR